MSRPSNLFPIAFALGVTILAPTADAQSTKTTQNCISNYYVVDSNGQCIGDSNGGTTPTTVLRQFGNPSTIYAIFIQPLTGFLATASFDYPTTDCTGQAYLPIFSGPSFPFRLAVFDGNGVFWAPSSTIQTTITVRSTLNISPIPPGSPINPPGRTCNQFIGPPPGPPPPTVLVGAAEQVDSTFANTVVPPLVATCQIFDPDRSTSKGACKVRSDH